ncbi:hypothetical protein L7F22_008294 [Adiantum nelumboides]|nr:hypothetical protein [Adiantum nelumboides]
MVVSFPTFYGHHDENARDFMDSLEMAHLMAGRDQEEVKLRAFPLVLKGEARVWYDALAPPSKATWPALYGAFLNKYGQGDTPENLWKQIPQHRQGSLGDYNTYESKFTNLWERWAASLQGQGGAPNFLKRDKFVEGMFPTLKEKVEAKFPQTFEEAQEIATVKFKKLLYQERKSNCVKEREEVNVPQHTNNAQPRVASISADSHQEDLLHKLTQQLETLTLNLVQAPTKGQQPRDDARPLRRSTQELRCWNCNEPGHGMYHCPHPRRIPGDMYPPRRPPQTVQFDVPQQPPTIQRGPPPNQEQARGPRRQAQEYHCYNCGENGHGMYYCPHPRRIGNFRGPRDQVSPPRERQQQQPTFPIQQAPPVQIPRPPMQPQSQQSPSPPPPIVPIPPLPIQENRVVNVISLDVKVKSKKEDRGKSLPKDKGKAKVEDVDVLSIKRSRKEEVAISERRERRKSKENGDSSSKKKSKPKRKITTKDLALGESYQPYNLVDDALIHGPKITWPQLLHLASKVRRQWTKMVSTRCVKTKAMGLVSNRNLRDITPALEAYVKGKRVSNVYVDGGAQICDMIEQTMHHLGLKVNAPAPCTTKMANNAKGEGYPIILGRPWLMAMQARQDWGTDMLKLQPHQGGKKGKAIHIDLRAGKHESLDLGTSVDELSSSKYFTSREKSIVTEYSDSSQAKIMEVMITNPAMVSSNNILQVKEGFLVDGYNQITGAFMVHINKQQKMAQMFATTIAKFCFDFLLKMFVTMEGSLSFVLKHWLTFTHFSKWIASLQQSNYTIQIGSSTSLADKLTHKCHEEKIQLDAPKVDQGKEVVLLGETHSPNLDGVYTLKLNKATIEIVIYNEKEAKLFGVNLVVDRFMFSDALLSAKQVKIPWICGSQSLVSQDWKELKLVKKIIGTQPLLTKEIQGVSTTTSEPPYYEVIANKKLLQVLLSQQRKHWLDTMRLREIEAFPEDPNNRRRWLIRKATRYKNSLEMAHLMAGRDQEEVKLRAFPLVLKGEARVWYDALAPPSKATWPALYGAFLNKYGQGDTPENLWKQIPQHRQGSLGDYNTYESKFTNLWERWAASLQGQGGAPNFLKRDKFVEGMFPTLKEKVEAKFPQTFEEAQEIATVKFKKLLYQERKSNCVKEREEVNVPQHTNNAQPRVASISADSHQEDLLHKLTQQLETLTLNLVQAPTKGQQPRDDARPLRRSTQELRCWNCNEPGHGMYHCPHPRRIPGDMYPPRRPPQTVQFDVPQQPPTIQRGPPPNQEQARGPRRQAQEYHCYNCGENGHGVHDTPPKLALDAQEATIHVLLGALRLLLGSTFNKPGNVVGDDDDDALSSKGSAAAAMELEEAGAQDGAEQPAGSAMFVFPIWQACRRKHSPDSPFFASGNLERELLAKQVILDLTDEEKLQISCLEDEQLWKVKCPVVGCKATLNGLTELETHFFSRHTAVCSVCSRVFPTSRLLDLHISETHDSFFQAKAARGHAMVHSFLFGVFFWKAFSAE